MRIRLFGSTYVAACTFNERKTLRRENWDWDKVLKKWVTVDIQKVLKYRKFAEGTALDTLSKFQEFEKKAFDASRAVDTEFSPPCPEGKAYFPFQKAGIEYGIKRRATLIADEPGLGKTIQAIGITNCNPNTKKVIVVCEASHKAHWKREFENWTTLGLTAGIVKTRHKKKFIDGYFKNGKPRWRIYWEKLIWPDTDVVIINYDILDMFEEQIHSSRWDYLICDEAHALMNEKSKRTRSVLGADRTSKRVQNRWVSIPGKAPIPTRKALFLTGTPMPSKPVELWPLIKYSDPSGLGRDYEDFVYRYCAAYTASFGLDVTGSSNSAELQKLLRQRFMIRRLKMDVLKDLPPKRRNLIVLPSDGLEDVIHAATHVLYERLSKFEEMLGLTIPDDGRGDDAIIDIMEAVADKVLDGQSYEDCVDDLDEGDKVLFEEIATVRQAIAIAKIPMAIEHIEKILNAGRKVIIFIYHKAVGLELQKHFEGCAYITGATHVDKRQPEADRFQEDPECRVFIGQFTAAGKGFTLTAAHDVVCVELDWSPSNITQAEDRAHRIGQTNFVNVDHLVLENSLEVRMAQRLIQKQEVIKAVLDGEVSLNCEPHC